MTAALAQVIEAFETHGDRPPAGRRTREELVEPDQRRELSPPCSRRSTKSRRVGVEPKFPLTAAPHLALICLPPPGSRYQLIAVATLDGMGWRGLYDDVEAVLPVCGNA